MCLISSLFFPVIIDYIIIFFLKKQEKSARQEAACVSVTKPIWSITNFSSKISLGSVKISAHVFGLFRWNLNVITFLVLEYQQQQLVFWSEFCLSYI